MAEDLFVKNTGEFGIWQAIVVTAVYLGKCLSSMQLFAYLIIAAPMPFACVSTNKYNEDQLKKYSSVCSKNCSLYIYDRSMMENTITSEWNLVCDKEWLIDFSQSVFSLGMLIGQPLFGYISDRYGRRMPNFIALAIAIAGTMGTTLGSNYSTFAIFRFISGFGVGGCLTISFVILVEASGNRYREVICNLYHIPFVFGEMLVAGIGYALNRWRILYFVLSLPHVLLVVVFLFVPESPIWLISVGKTEKAENVMMTIVRRNKLKEDDIGAVVSQITETAIKSKQTISRANFFDLIKTASLRKKIIHCCSVWLVTGLCYYGIQQYISELNRNIYANIVLSSLIQIPVPIVIIVCHKTYGRKTTALLCSIASGVCFVVLPLVDEIEWLRLAMASIGSFITFGLFCTLYVYTGELFPTVVRSMAMGVTDSFCRLGGMVAPFIASVASYGDWIPPLIFGLLSFIVAYSLTCLPETKGINLTDNLKDEQLPNDVSNTNGVDATDAEF